MTTSVPLSRRAGGPDLARGLALLGIGLANIVGWIHGQQWTVLLKQADATVVDRAADVLIALLADNRGFPLFAMLFGYGIGIMYRRSRTAREATGRFVMRMLKRHVVLGAIGLAHAILLFSGDILVDYAVVGTLCVLLVTRRQIVQLAAAVITLPALGVWGWADAVTGLSGRSGYAAAQAPDYVSGLLIRLDDAMSGMALSLVTDIGLLCPMLLGALAARLRLLEAVGPNRDVLSLLAGWGLSIGVVGAVPLVVVMVADPHLTTVSSATVLGVLGVIHQLTGLIGALGLAAACALLAERSRGPVIRAFEALGVAALTTYVLQSVVFAALFPPYTLDFGARWGTAGAAVVVLAAWLVMLPGAALLRRAGRRGPLEWLLRRLAGSTRPSAPSPRALTGAGR